MGFEDGDGVVMKKIFDKLGKKNVRVSPEDMMTLMTASTKSRMGAPKPMTKEEQTRRKKKTESVRKLAQQIHKLRRKLTTDMKSDNEKTRLTALAIAIMDKTAERVGNEQSAKEGHVGVTGFKNNQLTVNGNTVSIKYTGKSGVKQEKQFTDKLMAKLLKECKGNCKDKGGPVLVTSDGFKIKADKVNRYLKEFGVTAKDIRGYAANTLVTTMLKSGKKPSTPEERQKKFREVMKAVAEKVGHQQATLKKHYLLPGIEESYVKSGNIKSVKNASVAESLTGRIATEKLIVEDEQTVTEVEVTILEAIAHWAEQHTYEGKAWDGIEKFHLSLAMVVPDVSIQTAGWYKYPGSTRDDMDGKDWRLVISPSEQEEKVVINCHSLLHDGTWTLSTTVFSTNEIDGDELPTPTGHDDPWFASMIWSTALAKELQTSGYDYEPVINNMAIRMELGIQLWDCVKEVMPIVNRAHAQVMGEEHNFEDFTIAVNNWNLPEGKIASYRFAKDETEWPVMTVSPRVFKKGKDYIYWVIAHELIHAAVGGENGAHPEEFEAIADLMGIPEEYQD